MKNGFYSFFTGFDGQFAYFPANFLVSMSSPATPRRVPAYLLTILRIYLGVILLYTVIGKLIQPTPFSDELLSYLNIVTQRARISGLYLHFLRSAVIPHIGLFSYLVIAGELVAGVGLLTGTLTRMSAFVAAFLFLNYMLSKGRWFWSPDSEDAAVFFIALVVLLGRAGRVFGVDRFLANRWPGGVLW